MRWGGAMWAAVALAASEALLRCAAPTRTRTVGDPPLRAPAPLVPPARALAVYHLGHSLVGNDMPAMLAQLAGPGHRYHTQLGWGASLQHHWGQARDVPGYAEMNNTLHHRDAHAAVESGEYDAIVFTEMVEIRDAIRYFQSAAHLVRWAHVAHARRNNVRLYVYETWHRLDDREGWLERIDRDLPRHWLAQIITPAEQRLPGVSIHLIPGGQVLAAFVRAVEARGGVGNIRDRRDLFARNPDGSVDPIHLNQKGMYLIALTHYAVLYHRSPIGLLHRLVDAHDNPIDGPTADAARLMQETVWDVVRALPRTGVVGRK